MFDEIETLFTVVFEDTPKKETEGMRQYQFDATFCCQTGCIDI